MRRLLLLLISVLSVSAVAADDDLVPADLGARVAAAFVEPAVAGFAEASAALRGDIHGLCATPSPAALAKVRSTFGEMVDSWGRLSILRFGPLVADNRFETIFFWPDPRGVTLKQVQGALAASDPSVTDAASLAGKSVALQNLLAFEFVLFGTGSESLETEATHRCAYASALAARLQDHAAAIAAAWSPEAAFGGSFVAPSDAGYYRTQAEVMGELVKALQTGVDFIAAAELRPALGDTVEDARGRRAPLWRSDLAFGLVGAQLSGLLDLMASTGLESSLPATNAAPLNNLAFNLGHALATLDAIELPAEAAFADPGARKKLEFVTLQLGFSSETIGKDLTAALGLSMGFNALDGD